MNQLVADAKFWLTSCRDRKLFRRHPHFIAPFQLLRADGSVWVAEMAEFGVSDHFRPGIHDGAGIRISQVRPSFTKYFASKKEVSVSAGTIYRFVTLGGSMGDHVLRAVAYYRPVYLADVWKFLSKQPQGEEGFLSRGTVNYFFVRTRFGLPRFIYVQWNCDRKGWQVGSISAFALLGNMGGNRVFTR